MTLDVEFDLDSLPEPGDRFEKLEIIHDGFDGIVWKAKDCDRDGAFVAIKIFRKTADAEREFKILTACQSNPIFPMLLGAFCDRSNHDQVWVVMEYLPLGSLSDLVNGLLAKEKRMREEHIAFVLREVMQGLIDLHSKGIAYRDLKASNIMLDSAGDIKIIDFSSCKILEDPEGKMSDTAGSPHWTAPEVFQCLADLFGPVSNDTRSIKERRGSNVSFVEGLYDVRADVWSLGILAIELGDGDPPLFDVDPSRAMYQIVRNPPPSLHRESDWSEEFVDFIAECLTSNPEYRPVMEELKEHPFIASVPEKDLHLRSELKFFAQEHRLKKTVEPRLRMKICPDGLLRAKATEKGKKIFPDDLARMPELSGDAILTMLERRYDNGLPNAFAGDVLLTINGHDGSDNFGKYNPENYMYRAMSDNEPHAMAVADKAWQEMLHHKLPQLVVLSGESGSGKTDNFNAITHHLCRLGHGNRLLVSKIQQLNCILNAFISAPTKINPSGSTRAIHLQELTFSKTGKATGANNWIYGLDVNHLVPERLKRGDGTFLIFYYFYHGLNQMGDLEKYKLDPDVSYKLLAPCGNSHPEDHAAFFGIIQSALKVLELSDHETENIYRCLAAIFNLAQVVVESDGDGGAVVRNQEFLHRAAGLLGVDKERLLSSVTHVMDHSGVPKRRMRYETSKQHIHSLITCLYHRLVDWVVHVLNTSFSLSRKVFGDDYSIGILDHYGYEDFHGENGISQLFVNTTNDFMQYFYNQQVFIKELGDLAKEEIKVPGSLVYKDIRPVVDFVLHASEGLFKSVDLCSVQDDGSELMELISKSARTCAEGLVTVQKPKSTFQLLHAHKPVTYHDVGRFSSDNSAHLFEQIALVMAASNSKLVKSLFGAKIRLTGGLVVDGSGNFLDTPAQTPAGFPAPKLEVEGDTLPPMSKHLPTRSKIGFSQTKTQLTRATMCRAALMSLMNKMVVCSPLFVRCIRSSDQPAAFQQDSCPPKLNLDVVARQLKHMGVMETIKLRQFGYSSRIPFSEFLRRYKFLVFDFEETVEENEENCKLLFLRLKIEHGWDLGKTQVCFRYYVEEYLARLYEKEVRKIIKIQAMVRRYLARIQEKNKIEVRKKQRRQRTRHHKFGDGITEEEAAVKLQKVFRGYKVRKDRPSGKVVDHKTVVRSPGGMTIDVMHYWRKWRSRTIFQQLQHYRSQNTEQLIYFSQQVHLYAQDVNNNLRRWNDSIGMDKIEPKTYLKPTDVLRSVSPRPLCKLPLRLADMMYIETSHLRDPFGSRGLRTPTSPVGSPSPAFPDVDEDDWDAPLRKAMRAPPTDIPTLRTVSHHEGANSAAGSGHQHELLGPESASGQNSTHAARAMSKQPSAGAVLPSRNSPGLSPTFNLSHSPTFADAPAAPSPPPSILIKKFDQQQQTTGRWQPKQCFPTGQKPSKQGGQSWLPMSAAAAVPGPECLNDMRKRLRKTACGQAIHSGSNSADPSQKSFNHSSSGYTTEKITPKSSKGSSVETQSKFGVIKRPRSPKQGPEATVYDFQSMLKKTNYRAPATMDSNNPANNTPAAPAGDTLWEELRGKLNTDQSEFAEDPSNHDPFRGPSSIGRTPPCTGTSTPINNYQLDDNEDEQQIHFPHGLTIDIRNDFGRPSSAKGSSGRSSVSSVVGVVNKALLLADHVTGGTGTGTGDSNRRDSSTLAHHMKNLSANTSSQLAKGSISNYRRTSDENRQPLTEGSSDEEETRGSTTLSASKCNTAAARSLTPTLVYQPSSVDEGDGDGHFSAKVVFDEGEEICF